MHDIHTSQIPDTLQVYDKTLYTLFYLGELLLQYIGVGSLYIVDSPYF